MKRFLLLFICLPIALSGWAEVTFKASAPTTIAVGQQFRLSYTLNEKGKDLRIPEIKGFDVVFGPTVSQGSSTHISGTQVETVYNEVYTYILRAKEEGSFDIVPATVTIGGSQYQSNTLKIKVIPADKAASAAPQASSPYQDPPEEQPASKELSADDIFIRAHVSKNSVYENEGFLITYKLYFRVNLSDYSIPAPNFDGFVSQIIEQQGNIPVSTENYNGKTYRTAVLRQYYLFPQRSGKMTIPSDKIDIIAQVLVRRARSFFDNDQYANVKKSIYYNAVNLDVKPLPSGRPASFSGALGDYKITSSISSENVKANEAVTVKITISGNGNLKMMKNPEIVFPNDFELYDPKVDLNTRVTTSGVTGTKTIEYLAIPRYAGDFTIPSTEISFFDPKSGTYKKYNTPEYKLHVEKGKGGAGGGQPMVTNYSNKEDIKYLGKDIRYIKTEKTNFKPQKDFLFGTTGYMLWYLIPAVLFIIFFIIYRKQARENANIALVRTKKANKVATKRLKIAGKLLKENKKEAFSDEVLRALWGYLSDKLNIPVASLSKDNVEIELAKYGADNTLIKELMDILSTCEFARYAPSQGTGEMDKLYASTMQAMDRMENTIKK